MNELIAPGYKFELMLSEDGSGRGAALVAAVAARKKNELGVWPMNMHEIYWLNFNLLEPTAKSSLSSMKCCTKEGLTQFVYEKLQKAWCQTFALG